MAITFRNAASANANTVAITTPASKDIIIVFAFNNASTTIPTVPASYKSLGSNSTTACAGVAAIRISDGTETSVPAFTNATQIVAMIYRGAFDAGGFASGVGNSNVVTYPALTMKVADGTSWVIAGAIDKGWSAGSNGTTTNLTSNRTNQTTCNGLDTNAGVASFGAQTLTGTGSGRFVAFSVELIAMPLVAETLTQNEGAKVQIRGGSVDYNLLDALAGGDTDTAVTGTAGLEQLSFVDVLRFVDANKAAFAREVDVMAQNDSAVVAIGLLLSASDQIILTDSDIVKELGGSFVFELLTLLGNTAAAGTVGTEQIVMQDPTFTETLEYDLVLTCPEFSNLWNDYGALDFVLTPSQVEKGDFTPWSLNALPGNAIPFENFEFVLAPSLINMIERGLVGLMADSYSQVLGSAGLLTEILSDTMTLTDALAIGYGEGMVEQLVFTDANGLGYGDIITDALTLSDAEAAILGMLETFSDTLTLSDFLAIGYGDLISDTLSLSDSLIVGYGQGTVDSLTFSDSTSVGYGDIISDSLTLSDTDVIALSFEEPFSDTLTMSDSEIIGYGNATVDSLTFSDSNSIGYGDQIAESLSFSDSLIIGYGNIEVDTLIFSDSITIRYGLQIADSINFWADTTQSPVVPSIPIVVTDYLQAVDILAPSVTYKDSFAYNSTLSGDGSLLPILPFSPASSGYVSIYWGEAIVFALGADISLPLYDAMLYQQFNFIGAKVNSAGVPSGGATGAVPKRMLDNAVTQNSIAELLSDAMTLSDSETIGYGNSTVDSLTFLDSNSIGYGDIISDTMTLSDSEITVLGINELFSDQLVLSDSETIGYGNSLVEQLVFSDSNSVGYGDQIAEQLVLSDSTIIGYGQAETDALTFSDSTSIGYGDQISDSLSLSDTAVEVLGIAELLSDTLSLSDSITAGYGDVVSDQLVLSDAETIGYGQGTVDSLTFSDSSAVGYGDLISDSFTLVDVFSLAMQEDILITETLTITDSQSLGYGFLIADQLVLSESVVVAEELDKSITETLAISDFQSLGYGFLISDSFTLTDSFAFTTGAALITEQLSDTLSLSDFLAVGYGQGNVDSLTLTDSSSLGFGDVISDTLTQGDSEVNVLGIVKLFSDQLILTDSLADIFGDLVSFSDTLSFSDSLIVGYGQGTVDALTFADSTSVGYGDVISDAISLADSESALLAMLKTFSDQLVFSDSLADLLSVALTFSDTLTQSDSETIGYGNKIVEQLIFLESQTVGFGDLISDSLNNWLDQFQFTTAQPSISLQFSDQLALSEALGAGYGNQTSDQNALSDVMSLMESFEVLLSEATPQMVEALAMLMAQAMTTQDSIAFWNDTYSAIGAYLAGLSDVNTLTDQFGDMLAAQLSLLLSDAEGAAWLDAFLTEIAFSPGAIRMQSLVILNEIVGKILTTRVGVTRE